MNAMTAINVRRCGNCSYWTPTRRDKNRKQYGRCGAPMPEVPASTGQLTRHETFDTFGKRCPTFEPVTTALESVR